MLAPFLALVMQKQAIPDTFKGSGLYRQCKAHMRTQEPNAPMLDYAAGALCVGYINGLIDGLQAGGSRAVCVNGATIDTLARVYTVFMDANPKLMDEYESEGLVLALAKAYPCLRKLWISEIYYAFAPKFSDMRILRLSRLL